MIKLASEKSFNRGIFPVMNIKGKTVTYPFKAEYKSARFAIGQGILGPKQMMIMDILGTKIIHDQHKNKSFIDRIPSPKEENVIQLSQKYMSYNLLKYLTDHLSPLEEGKIPKEWYSDEGKLYEIDKNYGRIKKAIGMYINDGFLKRELPFLKNYSSLQICEMIKQTSECRLMMNFPIRYHNGKEYKTFPYANGNIPSRFFSLLEINNTRVSSDKHILEREYTIKFDTILGYLFVQNNMSGHVDLLPGRYYELTDYAQLFYRFFVLPFFGNVKNHLSLEEIRTRLVLVTKDTSMVRKTIRRIMDELADNNFISEPLEEQNYGKYLYSYKRKTWKEITKEEVAPSESDLR